MLPVVVDRGLPLGPLSKELNGFATGLTRVCHKTVGRMRLAACCGGGRSGPPRLTGALPQFLPQLHPQSPQHVLAHPLTVHQRRTPETGGLAVTARGVLADLVAETAAGYVSAAVCVPQANHAALRPLLAQ